MLLVQMRTANFVNIDLLVVNERPRAGGTF